ncbi:hypothetical protein GCM10009623_02080 [Nocardioides aestuarii]|uniref:Uncharacterized protein n=1 Tax=Nocardioides aestuarii TaxID=252231 RepID=A0ABW4TK05_9ACTN
MRTTYRFLANAIAVLVVVQAGAIAWAFFGLTNWIQNDNGVVDKALLECTDCEQQFTAEWGFAIHMFFNGIILIPLVTLLLLIVSFFAKVRGGVALAGAVFGLVVLQVVVLPALSREVGSGFGALHGVNALLLMGVAMMAGKRAAAEPAAATGQPVTA